MNPKTQYLTTRYREQRKWRRKDCPRSKRRHCLCTGEPHRASGHLSRVSGPMKKTKQNKMKFLKHQEKLKDPQIFRRRKQLPSVLGIILA